jgi:hypothetical protein
LYYNFIKDKVIPECTPFPGPRYTSERYEYLRNWKLY